MGLERHLGSRITAHDMHWITAQNTYCTTNDPAVNGLSQDEIQTILDKIKASLKKPEDRDQIDFHGTNVALCAGSAIWGAASGAKIVSYDIANVVPGSTGINVGPSESLLFDALKHIRNHPDVKDSIINCSWHLWIPKPKAGESEPAICQLFNEVVAAGAHVVGSAGNEAVSPVQSLLPMEMLIHYLVPSH